MSKTRRPEKSLNHPSYETLIQGKMNEAQGNITAIRQLLDQQGEDRVALDGDRDFILYVDGSWGVEKGGDRIRIPDPGNIEVILGYFVSLPQDTEPEQAFRRLETKFLQADAVQRFVEYLAHALRGLQSGLRAELR